MIVLFTMVPIRVATAVVGIFLGGFNHIWVILVVHTYSYHMLYQMKFSEEASQLASCMSCTTVVGNYPMLNCSFNNHAYQSCNKRNSLINLTASYCLSCNRSSRKLHWHWIALYRIMPVWVATTVVENYYIELLSQQSWLSELQQL